jgi:malate dehydrogenase
MERGDLLEANGAIFTAGQGAPRRRRGRRRIRVTGSPANTNALIAMSSAPISRRRRRAHSPRPQPGDLAARQGRRGSHRHQEMTIWGNHQPRYPDISVRRSAAERRGWSTTGPGSKRLRPDRAQARRGDHRRPRRLLGRVGRIGDNQRRWDWGAGTPVGDWVSMAAFHGSYGVPEA